MPLSINTNIESIRAQRQTDSRLRDLRNNFERLSSGKAINKASDNPANLAVAISLLSNADTGVVATRNISDGVSAANIADGALQQSSDIVGRLDELATQSANGTLSDSQRQAIDEEAQALVAELDRISGTTQFNGQQLLDGSTGDINIQAGTDGSESSQISLSLSPTTSSSLGISGIDLSTQEGARTALSQISSARDTVNENRAEVGAVVNRLGTAFENLKTSEVNQRAAASRIIDVDVAKESASLVANRIGTQAGLAVQAQANVSQQVALTLLS